MTNDFAVELLITEILSAICISWNKSSRIRMCQPKTVTKNWRFRQPVNRRIQNRVTRSPQKTRGPDGQIVSFETIECIICNMEEGTMLEPDSQFLYYEGLDANCFVSVCTVVTSKTH